MESELGAMLLRTHIERHLPGPLTEPDQLRRWDAAVTALQTASRKLDKAVTKGVLHKNNAANHKSAISKKVAAL